MYFEIIAERCGHQADAVTDRAKRDFWLSASEAQEYGLVNKIVSAKSDLNFNPANL